MKVLAAMAAALSCAACQFVPGTEENRKAAAISAVRELLADGPAARFENVRIAQTTDAVCGQVNAKNSYGAYAGNALFVVSKEGRASIDRGAPDIDAYHRYQLSRISSREPGQTDSGLLERTEQACDFVDEWIAQCAKDFSPSLAVEAVRCRHFRQQESQR